MDKIKDVQLQLYYDNFLERLYEFTRNTVVTLSDWREAYREDEKVREFKATYNQIIYIR